MTPAAKARFNEAVRADTEFLAALKVSCDMLRMCTAEGRNTRPLYIASSSPQHTTSDYDYSNDHTYICIYMHTYAHAHISGWGPTMHICICIYVYIYARASRPGAHHRAMHIHIYARRRTRASTRPGVHLGYIYAHAPGCIHNIHILPGWDRLDPGRVVYTECHGASFMLRWVGVYIHPIA